MNDLSFVSDWSGNTAYISNTSDSISGSRSLYMNVETSSSQSVKCDFDFKPAVFEWKYKWNVYSTGSLGDKFFITLRDANGERLFYLVFEIDDTPEGDDQVVQPRINKDDSYDLFLDQKTTYTMKAVFDYSSNTFDFYVDGNLKFSDVSFMDSPSDFSNTTIHMQGNADANNWEKWVDDVYIKKV